MRLRSHPSLYHQAYMGGAGREKIKGRIFSINIGETKGASKRMIKEAHLVPGHGLEGDAHAGPGLRQVSLLSIETIEEAESQYGGDDVDFHPGLFAENITTEGFDFSNIKVGDKLLIGESIVLSVTQIGKQCHDGCAIKKQVGRCVMPTRGVFAVVERGGEMRVRDHVRWERRGKGLFSWLKR